MCDTAIWNATINVIAGSTGAASSAMNRLSWPSDVFMDGNEQLYVVDTGNNRVQRFPRGNLTADTVAGFNVAGGSGYSELDGPTAIFVAADGTLYIMDTNNYRVVKWLPNQPLGFAVAGGRGAGTTYDKLGVSYAVFVDDQLNVYVSEYGNHRVTIWMNGNTTAGTLVRTASILPEFDISCFLVFR